MKKRILSILAILLILPLLLSNSAQGYSCPVGARTSFRPTYDFTKKITGIRLVLSDRNSIIE